jgi:hypothetical protein
LLCRAHTPHKVFTKLRLSAYVGGSIGDLGCHEKEEDKEKPAPRPANVVNLMEALRRSIEAGGGEPPKAAKPGGKRGTESAPAKKRASRK